MAIAQQPSTKQDILQYLWQHDSATAQELATQLEISQQAVRRHLKDLEVQELIFYSAVAQEMGRPQHVYQLSSKGSDRVSPASSINYSTFAVSLLDTLAETVGPDQVSHILGKQWERKAIAYREALGDGSLQERVTKLVELRKAEGFMAECHSLESDRRFIMTEHKCAISNVAESFPSICGHELEMFAQVLPDCIVERTHWIINGEQRCGYLVEER
ncbi:iron-sulfur cluster biosynthesis transcriptional regulator SufR [Aliterella atlantica]|uniref:Transcriptional regulator n=1 Tax=Aliterella atlantica CENA595 TaxID=1618023 RepID=A0A0D8ZP57_9CYAN|nr:iron-sulfur cluster biosynthesis transcriptional regulator SufR [Aliterella atlantica]KJH70603.1 transcriptional regulator [Aliterella atlantica CENA595]